jgi:hypothetical protein
LLASLRPDRLDERLLRELCGTFDQNAAVERHRGPLLRIGCARRDAQRSREAE